MATTTFLFTDIEGSTRLWDAHGDAMARALEHHDTVIDEAVTARGGRLFKHTGDGHLAAFPSAPAAVEAAAAAQRNIAAADMGAVGTLRVRMGVHTGDAAERDGDFFGHTLNRTSRIMDAARGGQVLVSAATAALVRDDLPDGFGLDDLGEHRLKDLGEPERLHLLVGPGLSTDLGPVRSLERRPNNLPVQLTSFIGRERELAEVLELLDQHRIVTLTGVGGVGKTRLALQAAAESVDDHPNGVWFVELAPLSEQGFVLPAIAAAAGIVEEPTRPLIDTIARDLGGDSALLVVDNCEHLIDEVAKVTDDLLRACPDLRIIATSREGLAVSGERLWRCPSMRASDDAMALFMERAELVGGLGDDPETRRAVERICRRLDGIPLAIELATARLKVFTPEQLAERLDDRFRLLTGGSRTAMPRQRTLQAAMDWSHDLLPDHERILLRRLGVFHGGFTLETVERVCSDETLPDFEMLDLVTHLVDASLVAFERGADEPRYRLLETVRQYAMDRLFDGGEAEEYRRRHAEEFERMMRGADVGLLGPDSDRWARVCREEADNVRAALTWASESGASALALRLAAAYGRYWFTAGQIVEGTERLTQILRADHEPSPDLAEANSWLAHFLFLQDKVAESKPFAERSLAVAESLDHPHALHRSLMVQANILNADWELEESIDAYVRIADLTRDAGSDYLTIALFNIAMNAPQVGRYEEAKAAADEMVEHADAGGQAYAIAIARSVGAVSAFFRGDLDEARRHVEVGERHTMEAFPLPANGLAMTRANLALVDGDLDEAERHIRRSLAVAEQVGQPQMADLGLRILGHIALRRGDADEAFEQFATVAGRVLARARPDDAAWLGADLAGVALERGEAELAATLMELDRLQRERRRWVLPVPWQAGYTELEQRIRDTVPSDRLEAATDRAASLEGRQIAELIDELRR
ncbi:MAG: adenylate/guanylate cyclase domain-containing protein [Acidimicrobiia bacterium]|nr:adenylate/guanylate cyclase domain-containing protein [Acidimicrobiia bacterium]